MNSTETKDATCAQNRCKAPIVRIQRYHVTVEWERQEDGTWDLGTYDVGTHFHLFCANGHEEKAWRRDLPEPLNKIV
jgi:hypothetical protein